MNIRAIQNNDIEAVSKVCLDSFSAAIASTLSSEGITTFTKIASSAAFRERINQDNLILIAEEGESIKGIIELKQGRHIAMLFVAPSAQKQGVGKQLLFSALHHLRVNTVTVSASLPSVTAYTKYGFRCCGEIAESAGLIYQPMEMTVKSIIND